MIGGGGPAIAIVDAQGEHTYAELDQSAQAVARRLLNGTGMTDLGGERIAFRIAPGIDYVATLTGIWRAGGVAVPLCLTHPEPELAHVLDDSQACLVMSDEGGEDLLRRLATARRIPFIPCPGPNRDDGGPVPDIDASRAALILYTSGTTGKSKGVVTSHAAIAASVDMLVEAWGWTAEDRIVHVLPLHHTHGIVNALLCALRVGAVVDFLPAFDAATVWRRFVEGLPTLFMAVPNVYSRLLGDFEDAAAVERRDRTEGAGNLRLMVSGSAALPIPLFERWVDITGHRLLECYGMTEIGMALSNPLKGERRPGFGGLPLPAVKLRLVDEEDTEVADGSPGELQVRSPAMFSQYWNRPEETEAAFYDGWFRTGDVAIVEDGAYRILGRQSVDIIETGGYKVSALKIEDVLGGHPDVVECAVVGIADDKWGEAVCAAVVCRRDMKRNALRDWARDYLAPYELPRQVVRLQQLPKNAMGIVTKSEVRALFESGAELSQDIGVGHETV
jgi:malonyl-CoA/methylmalonyl-CoA synthetase